jgi:hypothetical protein
MINLLWVLDNWFWTTKTNRDTEVQNVSLISSEYKSQFWTIHWNYS